MGLLGKNELPEAFHRRIQDRAGGNPFYIEEILRSLIDQGDFSSVDGGIAPIRIEMTMVITAALIFAESFPIRHAVSQSFAFGGQNAVLAFSELR